MVINSRRKLVVTVVILLMVTLLTLLYLYFNRTMVSRRDSWATIAQDQTMQKLTVAESTLTVEVVGTPESIRQGLSGRTEIGSDGMLFLFNKPQPVVFWMLDMQFPLDFIWILDGKIVGITENAPEPQGVVNVADLIRYRSPGQIDAVLEVPAGVAQANAWKVGAIVQLLPKQ